MTRAERNAVLARLFGGTPPEPKFLGDLSVGRGFVSEEDPRYVGRVEVAADGDGAVAVELLAPPGCRGVHVAWDARTKVRGIASSRAAGAAA